MRRAQNWHGGPKAGTLGSLRSPKPGDGLTTSGSAAFRHEQEWPAFGVRSGGEPAPSLDMAEVSQRSATGSRSSEGSILTRRDAPPDFLVSAITRAMVSSCVAVIASLTDAKAIARSVLQNVDMHVISVRLIGTRPEHRCEPATCSNADCIDRGLHMLVPIRRDC